MKSSPEPVRLAKPPREIRLRGRPGAAAPGAPVPAPADGGAEALKAAYQRGHVDGEKALSEALVRQRQELHEAMNGVLQSLRAASKQVIHDTENTLVAIALSAAQKLVADTPISVSMVEAVVRDALAQVEGTAHFTVRLHPADLELLQKAGSPVLAPGDDNTEFRFLSSPEVTRGGCLVQTHFGTVDARRETKYDLLTRSLLT